MLLNHVQAEILREYLQGGYDYERSRELEYLKKMEELPPEKNTYSDYWAKKHGDRAEVIAIVLNEIETRLNDYELKVI